MRNCSLRAISPFLSFFLSYQKLSSVLPHLKLLSMSYFSLRQSKSCGLVKYSYISGLDRGYEQSHSYETSTSEEMLSLDNPCFQCNIAITSFLVSNTCEIRFHDVIYRTVHMFTS